MYKKGTSHGVVVLFMEMSKYSTFCGSANGGHLLCDNVSSRVSKHFKKQNGYIKDIRFIFLYAYVTFF
jgi:hypothetical protein